MWPVIGAMALQMGSSILQGYQASKKYKSEAAATEKAATENYRRAQEDKKTVRNQSAQKQAEVGSVVLSQGRGRESALLGIDYTILQELDRLGQIESNARYDYAAATQTATNLRKQAKQAIWGSILGGTASSVGTYASATRSGTSTSTGPTLDLGYENRNSLTPAQLNEANGR